MLIEVSPEYKESSEALPVSAVDQLSLGHIFVKGKKPHKITAISLNKPLPEYLQLTKKKLGSEKSDFLFRTRY